ncbi:MAG: hypothetical protein JRJ65_05225 [Deltaproteobacteria bacterium]|nr:hypothetical protein [Deltaproteobacteria bacterium]
MSKREKIILAVMTLAILFVLFEFLFSSPDNTNLMVTKTQLEGLRNGISSLALSLPAGNLSNTGVHIIDIAGDEWKRNPFKELLSQKSRVTTEITPLIEENETEINLPVYIYSGFLSMGEKKLAIINGLEYEAGHELETGGYIVQQIKPTEVLLKSKNEERTISIALPE